MHKLILLLAMVPFCTGCSGCDNKLKHIQSNFVGLSREIVLYGADGHEIRRWSTKAKVEDNGGTCYFLNDKGRAVIVSGTFVIEEK